MDFRHAEQEYQRLKARYEQGSLSAEAFEAACGDTLATRDRFGRVWQIGVNTGKWYCFEDGAWVQRDPDETLPAAAAPSQKTPEALQPAPPPTSIFTLPPEPPTGADSGSAASPPAAPAPAERVQSRGRLFTARLGKILSWILLIGLLIILLMGLTALGTLLVREQNFGWNPRTPVRFGSPTPSRQSTFTSPPATATPSASPAPTTAPSQTARPSPLPSQTLTPAPEFAPQLWQPLENIYFTARDLVPDAWWNVLQSAAALTFEEYNQLTGLKISYRQEFLIYPAGEIPLGSAIQHEVVYAFSPPNSQAALSLMCRTSDGKDGYGLRATLSHWELFKTQAGMETLLEQGPTRPTLQQGSWSTLKLSCAGSQLNVWDETGLIATVEDSSLSVGLPALRFENPSPDQEELQLYFYRLLRREE